MERRGAEPLGHSLRGRPAEGKGRQTDQHHLGEVLGDQGGLAYVEQLQGQIDALCQTKKIGLQMELEHLPDVLSADKLLLERAIMNVINNALDYSPQGSFIHISIIGGKQHLQIAVTDTGPGFSQEDLLHAAGQWIL